MTGEARKRRRETPERTIIFVHGRDFKPAAQQLLDISIDAVSAGLERDCPEMLMEFHSAGKRLAYYGDISNAWLRDTGKHYDETLDIGDRRRALQELRLLQKRKHFGMSRYERLPGKTALREFVADLAAPVLGSVGLGGALIGRVAADVNEYWDAATDFGMLIRERVRMEIASALEQGHQVMLVSHGTGCIVAYDVLWQMSHHPDYAPRYQQMKIDRWLTLGAPLGDTTVRRRVFGAQATGRGRYPTNLLTWHNVSAEDDYLCHDSTLADDYREMLNLRLVSSIRDYPIYNLAVRYGRSNPHSSVGYLIHPRVTKIVADWLRRDDKITLPTGTS
jgi:hypothetical protein